MATLTVVQVAATAAAPGFTAAGSGGDEFGADNRTVLHVRNASATSITVMVASQVTDDIGVIADDLDFAVPAGTDRVVLLGRYVNLFRDANGRAAVTYSATTDVTVAVYRT